MVHIPGHIPPTGLIGAEQSLQPFAQPGLQAAQVLSARAGALGAPAQQQAIQDFASSPGQQFLRDQQEQALTRNASAIGGLGGGNVRTALQEQAFGRAQTDFGNQQQTLAQIAGGGLTAARDIGGFRTRAGEQIAGNLQGTTSALAALLSGAGQTSATGTSNLATILQNIAAGQGGQISGLGNVPGIQQTEGNIGGLGTLAAGLGTAGSFFFPNFSGFSDIRLKENIRKVGETPGGFNLYIWDWKEEAKSLVGEQPSFGVIAQELQEINPNLVNTHPSGFLRVNYGMVT